MTHEIFADGYIDNTGMYELVDQVRGLRGHRDAIDPEPFQGGTVVCFDVRKLRTLGLPREKMAFDLRMIFEWDDDLRKLVESKDLDSKVDFLRAERTFSAHVRAIAESKVDTKKLSLYQLIPDEVRHEYLFSRVKALKELWAMVSEAQKSEYEKLTWPVAHDVMEVESSKIKIDVQHVRSMLKSSDLAVHETKFLNHIVGCTKDGFARTRISPVGSRTWRLRVEGGLNCMAIPHGTCREAFVSRFDGGSILTLDFNAIDYRCLVAVVDDPALNEFYKDKRDFHAQTASLFGNVTPKLRDNIKKIAYTHIYGGTVQTLQKQTGLGRDELENIIKRLDVLFEPITRFRKKLTEDAHRTGYIVTPGMRKISIEPGDHEGKIIGLYGQSFSSEMFNRALHAVLEILKGRAALSRIIFTVHDEIVIDMHPDEMGLVSLLTKTMETVTGFVVKSKEGKNYAVATA